jgi:hypothetical protein
MKHNNVLLLNIIWMVMNQNNVIYIEIIPVPPIYVYIGLSL